MNDPETFGGCPYCGGNDGYFNLGRAHHFFCDACQVMWPFGEKLFSTWKYESEADWSRNRSQFNDYDWVKPVYDRTELERLGANVHDE